MARTAKKSKRIGPQQAHRNVQSGRALLVCAYDSEEKFHKNRLAGAISLDEFRSRVDTVPEEQEIIFYCA